MRNRTEAEREWKRLHYSKPHQTPMLSRCDSVSIPDNIQRREFHEPCFKCNASGACRHRVSYAELA